MSLRKVSHETELSPKTQVVMIPVDHLELPVDDDGDPLITAKWVYDHEDYPAGCQLGFVTSIKPGRAYVRYLNPAKYGRGLRTKGNSEGTPIRYLWFIHHSPDKLIEQMYERYCSSS